MARAMQAGFLPGKSSFAWGPPESLLTFPCSTDLWVREMQGLFSPMWCRSTQCCTLVKGSKRA